MSNMAFYYHGLPPVEMCIRDSIQAVREIFGPCETVGICAKDIPFGFSGVLIAAGACEIDLEFRAFFRLLNLIGVPIVCRPVCVFGDGDAAENDVFRDGYRDAVVLQREIPRFGAYGIDSFIQQIPFAGGDFAETEIRAAWIHFRRKPASVFRSVGIQQGFTFIQAVNRAVQRGDVYKRQPLHTGKRRRARLL